MKLERKGYVASLSAFRGLVALLVSLGHLEQVFVRPYSKVFSAYASLLAQASVMIFFAISGYSITSPIIGIIKKPNPCYEFFLRRFCRVLPPLIMAIVIMYLLSICASTFFTSGSNNFFNQPSIIRKGFYFDIGQGIGALFFLNGFLTATPDSNGPLWSLSYEVWLYVIFFVFYYAFYSGTKVLLAYLFFIYITLIFLDKSGSWFFF